jgi:cell division protein FtsI (penicillin-binding protein 3)
MGFAPVTNPAIVVVVTVNGTHGGSAGYGGPVAGPIFRAVATETLRVLDVPKDLPDTPPETTPPTQVADLNDVAIPDLDPSAPNVLEEVARQPQAPSPAEPATEATVEDGPKVPNFEGLSKRAVVAEAQAQGLAVSLTGAGIARTQAPSPGGILHPGERIRVGFVK